MFELCIGKPVIARFCRYHSAIADALIGLLPGAIVRHPTLGVVAMVFRQPVPLSDGDVIVAPPLSFSLQVFTAAQFENQFQVPEPLEILDPTRKRHGEDVCADQLRAPDVTDGETCGGGDAGGRVCDAVPVAEDSAGPAVGAVADGDAGARDYDGDGGGYGEAGVMAVCDDLIDSRLEHAIPLFGKAEPVTRVREAGAE